MDAFIINIAREYSLAIHIGTYIAIIAACFVAFCGCIRFGIAVWRRHKGIYPPAASQMEQH